MCGKPLVITAASGSKLDGEESSERCNTGCLLIRRWTKRLQSSSTCTVQGFAFPSVRCSSPTDRLQNMIHYCYLFSFKAEKNVQFYFASPVHVWPSDDSSLVLLVTLATHFVDLQLQIQQIPQTPPPQVPFGHFGFILLD